MGVNFTSLRGKSIVAGPQSADVISCMTLNEQQCERKPSVFILHVLVSTCRQSGCQRVDLLHMY